MNTQFNEAKQANTRQECAADNCDRLRSGLSRYCRAHERTTARYGHPNAYPIKKADYQWAVEKVSAIFTANSQHEGLKAALGWTQQWLDSALAGEVAVAGYLDLQRLDAHGVTALDILTAAAAFHVYEATRVRPFPDQRAADFAMSLAVLHLAPRECRTGHVSGKPMYVPYRGAALRGIGQSIRKVLPGFLANVRQAIEGEKAQLDSLRTAFTAPFLPSQSLLARAGEAAAVTTC